MWKRIAPPSPPLVIDSPSPSSMASAAAPGPGETAASRRAPGDSPPGAQPPVNGCRGRRRRRPRRPHRGPGNGEGAPPEPLVQDDGAPPVRGLPCVVDWSDRMERTAADMRRAIIVTAFGDRPPLRADEVKATLAGRFGLDQATIDAKPAGNDTFFVFLGDDATVARLVRAGPSTGAGGPRLHLRRWTRQAFAAGAALPVLVDVELRGIPAHAWEMSTAGNLLNPYAWPQVLHPATRNREDYSVFRLSAWCFRPDSVPGSRDLHIVEPSTGVIDSPPGKLTLSYPVSFSVHPAIGHEGSDSGFSSGGDGPGRRRRRRRDDPFSPSASRDSSSRAPRRTPVRPQPGPVASNTPQVAAVVEADGSGTVGLGPPATVTPIDESVSKGKQAAFLVETDDDDRGVGEPLAPCRPAALASNGQHAATDAEEGGNGLATTCCGVVLSDAQREAAVVEMAGPGTAETPRWTETSGDGAPPPSGVDPLVPDAIDATPIPNDGCASPSLVMPASPVIGPQTSVRRIGSGTEAPALELSPSPIMGFTPTASGGAHDAWDAAIQGKGCRGMDHEELPSVVSPLLSRFEVSNVRIQLDRLALTDAANPRSSADMGAVTPLVEVEVLEPPAAEDAVQAAPPLSHDAEINHAGELTWVADVNTLVLCPGSPVIWRPAEEILPNEPEPEHEQGQGRPQTIVYSRRPRECRSPAIPATTPAPATPPQHLDMQPVEEFTNRISKTLPPAVPVPTPTVQLRGAYAATATQAPRRSRRVAKLPLRSTTARPQLSVDPWDSWTRPTESPKKLKKNAQSFSRSRLSEDMLWPWQRSWARRCPRTRR